MAILYISAVWPTKVNSYFPVYKSQILAVLSRDPRATLALSLLIATLDI